MQSSILLFIGLSVKTALGQKHRPKNTRLTMFSMVANFIIWPGAIINLKILLI